MKIEKLYTLSQFIDLINHHDHFDGSKLSLWENRLLAIYEYNDFLKQPLTKDMVNNITNKPIQYNHKGKTVGWFDSDLFDQDTEAEKKVIFDVEMINKFTAKYPTGKNGAFKIFCITDFKTLHDLAEATNGELKLKNIEL